MMSFNFQFPPPRNSYKTYIDTFCPHSNTNNLILAIQTYLKPISYLAYKLHLMSYLLLPLK